jgi:hypothetical protein
MDELAAHYQPRVVQAVFAVPQAGTSDDEFLARLAEYQAQNGHLVSEVGYD